MQQVEHRDEYAFSRTWVWGGGSALLVVVAALFFMVWKSQFAAPAGYLFKTPTQSVEAAYCLAVAQDISPGGAPTGSYFDEATRFWLKRLRSYGGDIGGATAKGRARLNADIVANGGNDLMWLRTALEKCSNRALNYGARFSGFE